jgi:hypothetical protein
MKPRCDGYSNRGDGDGNNDDGLTIDANAAAAAIAGVTVFVGGLDCAVNTESRARCHVKKYRYMIIYDA